MNENQDSREVALITGGSSGIGLAIAHELAKRKYPLLLVSNQENKLIECKFEIENKFGVQCHTLFADLSTEASIPQIIDFCQNHGLSVTILVNNAGTLIFSEVVEVPENKVHAILHLHMVAPTMLCRIFGEQMKRNKYGYILNVSSISAVMPFPGISLYGPTKTYMRYFTRALRTEMKPYGVCVTCLLPGATATAMHNPEKVNIGLAKKLRVMHDPEIVAKKAVYAMFWNKAESIPGFINKITMVFLPLLPAFIVDLIYRNTRFSEMDFTSNN